MGALDHWVKHENITDDIAGDNYFEPELSDFIQLHGHKNIVVIVHDVGDKGKVTEFGVVRLGDNQIIEIEERSYISKPSLVATAI